MVLGLGTAQIVVTSAVIAFIAAQFGNSVEMSILIGASIALSSTATVMGILKERHLFNKQAGITCFSILLMQDLAVVPIIILQTQFSGATDDGIFLALIIALAKAIITILAIVIIGRKIIRPALSYADNGHGAEWFMPLILLLIIGAAAITQATGLSLVLGAFLAGLLINETEYRHEVELIDDPLRAIFMGIFFLSIGVMIDLTVLIDEPVWIPLSIAGIFAIKAFITFILCLLFRLPAALGIHCGLLLGQGGEFAFLIIGLSLSSNMISAEHTQFFFIVIALSMFISPFVAFFAEKIIKRMTSQTAQEDTIATAALSNHVIILGCGRVGTNICKILDDAATPYIAVDNSPKHISTLKNQGVNIIFGDASRQSFLEHINIASAQAVVITLNDFNKADAILKQARNIAPFTPIFVRARDKQHITELFKSGATHVVPETLEASLQMANQLLTVMEIPPHEITALLTKIREQEEITL